MEQKGLQMHFKEIFQLLTKILWENLFITPSEQESLLWLKKRLQFLDMGMKTDWREQKKSSEYKMVWLALKYRSDCTAVIHCHSVYLTSIFNAWRTVDPKCHEEFL